MKTLFAPDLLLKVLLGLAPAMGCNESMPELESGDAMRAATDSAADTLAAEGPVMCSTRSVCQFTWQQGQPRAGMATIANFCTHQKWPTHPSAGVYQVCLVDPQNNVYRIMLGGSVLIDMPGWTHSAYGGVPLASTLTPAGSAFCNQLDATVPFNQCPVVPASSPLVDGGLDANADVAPGG